MSIHSDDLADALQNLADGRQPRDESAPQHGDRPCPICGELMLVESFRGAEIDMCPSHGVWLDHEELNAVVGAPQRSAMSHRRAAELIRQAKREGKVSGTVLGVWSLLLPD